MTHLGPKRRRIGAVRVRALTRSKPLSHFGTGVVLSLWRGRERGIHEKAAPHLLRKGNPIGVILIRGSVRPLTENQTAFLKDLRIKW
jgi:hypothetical protein